MKEQFSLKSTYIVKGVAILLLLNYHLFEDAALVSEFQVDYRPFPLEIFLTFSEFGNVSVAIFVFLTAYGITKGILAQGETNFRELYCQAARRMAKLMLNFLAMFVSVTLLWAHWFDYESLYGQGKQGVLYMLADGMGLAQILDTPNPLGKEFVLDYWNMGGEKCRIINKVM